MTTALTPFHAVHVDEVAPIEVGPGCYRRDLPSTSNVRVWVVDMDPGSTWPYVDEHGTGEEIYIVSGEVIESGRRYGAGTYIFFEPGSSHQPTTETGVRIFGINLAG
jgi:anti-sigma factor ChrR (cupin superfamily)